MYFNRIAIYTTLPVLFFLEITLFDKLRIHGVRPELLLIATLFFGFHFGIVRGVETGLISGILKSSFSVTDFGINVFLFSLVGLFSGFLKDKLFKENFIIQFLLGCFAVLIWGQVSSGNYAGLLRDPAPYGHLWSKALYTGFLTPILFFIFAKIYENKNI